MLLLLVVTLALVFLMFFYFVHLPFKYWKEKNVPHPPISYLFGNVGQLVTMEKSIGQICDEIYNKYPDFPYVGFYRARMPCLLIRDPELVKEVMVKSFNSFRDNDIPIDAKRDPMFAKNPLASKGKAWKQNRTQSIPSFTSKRIKEMYPLMEEVANNLIAYININVVGSPNGVEAKEMSLKYTTDVVISCALGLEANSFLEPNSEYIKMIMKMLSPSFINNLKFVLWFNFPSLSKLFNIQFIDDDVGEYFKTLVGRTIDYRIRNNIRRGDFLDNMRELQTSIGAEVFGIHDITGHAFTFFTDGIETSAIVLSFTLYELAVNPNIQETVRRKIEETVDKHNGILSYDVVHEIEYLDKVITENMRKNTPVPVLSKTCTERFTFKSPYGNGEVINIEPGTNVTISTSSIHNDPKYYPEPFVYDPNRFADNNILERPKYTYLGFGEGPRSCLGQRFAFGQIKVALVYIIKNFEIRINKTTAVPYTTDPHYFLLAAKGGIRLDFYIRH